MRNGAKFIRFFCQLQRLDLKVFFFLLSIRTFDGALKRIVVRIVVSGGNINNNSIFFRYYFVNKNIRRYMWRVARSLCPPALEMLYFLWGEKMF